MSSSEHVYKKYRQADDDAGDLAWAAKLGKRAVWLPGEERADGTLGRLELSDDEKIFTKLLRLPRAYSDVERCGVLPDKEARRFMRALHAAEVLETQEIDKAKALVPLEIKRAKLAVKGGGKATPTKRSRSRLMGRVYRPSIDDEPRAAPAASQAPQQQEPKAPQANDAGATSEADMALEREIGQALRQQKGADHFSVLGVSKEAISDEVKEAYFTLAKRFHPDRLAGYTFKNPEVLEDKIERVFGRITEAYKVLQDPEQRRAYLEEVESGLSSGIKTGGKVRRTQEAGLQHKKGQVFLHKKDFANAQRMFQIAAELDNQDPAHPAYWAWARYRDERQERSAREKEAREKLEKIMKDSPHPDAAYFLGMILKLAEQEKKAYQAFCKAVELNPMHKEALREVRLYEMRRDKAKGEQSAQQKGGAGLLDRFLKK
jgi:curved DNA-binding protein CbpA